MTEETQVQRLNPLVREGIVYIAHPYTSDPERNLLLVNRWIRWAIMKRWVVPICPWYAYAHALNNNSPNEMEIGMKLNYECIKLCDELWLCGRVTSSGMLREASFAQEYGIPVIDFTGSDLPPTSTVHLPLSLSND